MAQQWIAKAARAVVLSAPSRPVAAQAIAAQVALTVAARVTFARAIAEQATVARVAAALVTVNQAA